MKKYLNLPYIFTPGASGVGTIKTNIVNFDIKLLVAIINATRETIIYSPGLSGKGFTAISGDTITLEFNTSTYSSSDVLQILYQATEEYPVDVASKRSDVLLAQLERLVKVVESLQTVDSAQRQRIVVDAALPAGANTIGAVNIASAQTLATVTTVTTLTNATQIAGMDREQYINIAKQTYAQSIRSRLTIQ